MSDPLYWKLLYLDGKDIAEPLENMSIKLARPGAFEMHIVRPDGKPVLRVTLKKGQHPLFMRRRSMTMGGQPRLDYTLFGRSDDNDDSTWALWEAAWGEIVDAPHDHILACRTAILDQIAG